MKTKSIPLASRMRPRNLSDFFGQKDLVGKKSFLRAAIENDRIPSMIFWGPPGSGKTTLASIIASQTNSEFLELSAVSSGVKKLQEIVEVARKNNEEGKRTILFMDEIHRWNKSQQDRLLPHIESGEITLIGATTENPSFEINSALVSRTRVLVLHKLEEEDIEKIIKNALKAKKRGLGGRDVEIEDDVISFLANISNGDARMALNTLEICADQNKKIDIELIKQVLQKKNLIYDKGGDEHFNIISALHKSMRGGDADAAAYWAMRMIEGGEDPIYIARRLVRFASEDIGLANNTALLLANATFEACQKLGYPECDVHLMHCVIYLAKSPKSILAYEVCHKTRADIKRFGNLSVPLHIRNAPTKLMKDFGYGKNYKYTPKEGSGDQEYLPEELRGKKYL